MRRYIARRHIALALATGILTLSLAVAAVANAVDSDSNAGPAQPESHQDGTLMASDAMPTIDELLADAGEIVVLPSGQEVPRHVLESFMRPSLCDGLHVGRSNAMSATLEARGLAHRIPLHVADRVGALVGSYCASDELTKTVAVVYIAEDRASGVALSNDQYWLDSVLAELGDRTEYPRREELIEYVGSSEANGIESARSAEIVSLLKVKPS